MIGSELNLFTYERYDLSSIDFTNLLEFATRSGSMDFIDTVLESAVNLKKVNIDCRVYPDESTVSTITKLFTSCTRLEYAEFTGITLSTETESVLNGINMGLFETKRLKRKRLKIKIDAYLERHDITEELLQRIGRIISYLDSSEIEDFMFILDLGDNGLSVEELKEHIASDVRIEEFEDELFLISNRNCKINGYGETWMMDL